MKKFFTLITGLLFMLTMFAQPNEQFRKQNMYQGKLSVSTMTSSIMKVVIDGTTYNSNNSDDEILVSNIKSGYHSIKVYQQQKNKKNNARFNKMQLIYEGNIYVKPQYHVDVTINRFGKAFVDEKQMSTGYYDDMDDNSQGGWDNDVQTMNGRSFDQFKKVIRNESFDNTRLVVAKQTIASNYFSAEQVKEIVQLFSFENSKLEIAKFSYKYTVDKSNYFMINDVFAYSSSKEDLARFIQAYR